MKADLTERSPAEKSHWPMASEREARVGKPAAKRGAGVALASQPARTSDGAGALGAKKLDKADSAETRMGWDGMGWDGMGWDGEQRPRQSVLRPSRIYYRLRRAGAQGKSLLASGRPKLEDREARAAEKRKAFGRGSKKPLESGFLREFCL